MELNTCGDPVTEIHRISTTELPRINVPNPAEGHKLPMKPDKSQEPSPVLTLSRNYSDPGGKHFSHYFFWQEATTSLHVRKQKIREGMPHSDRKNKMIRGERGQKEPRLDRRVNKPQGRRNNARNNRAMEIMLEPIHASHTTENTRTDALCDPGLRVPPVAKRAENTSGDNRESHLTQTGKMLHGRREPLAWHV